MTLTQNNPQSIFGELEKHARALSERLQVEGSADHAHQARNLEAMIVAARRMIEREELS